MYCSVTDYQSGLDASSKYIPQSKSEMRFESCKLIFRSWAPKQTTLRLPLALTKNSAVPICPGGPSAFPLDLLDYLEVTTERQISYPEFGHSKSFIVTLNMLNTGSISCFPAASQHANTGKASLPRSSFDTNRHYRLSFLFGVFLSSRNMSLAWGNCFL